MTRAYEHVQDGHRTTIRIENVAYIEWRPGWIGVTVHFSDGLSVELRESESNAAEKLYRELSSVLHALER